MCVPLRLPAVVIAAATLITADGVGAARTPLPGFESPTGNIRCFVVPGPPSILRCTIAQAAYAKTLVHYCGSPPIQVDWAGFELGPTRKGSVSCSGGVLYDPDTQRPTFVTLPYGRSWRRGVFTCTSRATGVTCRSRSGHGLFVSRRSWRGW